MNNLQKQSELVIRTLQANKNNIGLVTPFDFSEEKITILDFTSKNTELSKIDLTSTERMNEYVFGLLEKNGTSVGAGGYLEDRVIYRRSTHFDTGEEPRSVHLGIDIWMAAGTPLYAPLDGFVHSFKDNNVFGDYGPTIIVEYILDNVKFYTLFGHLSRESLVGMYEGKKIRKGEQLASVGNFPINGDWPPHVHFQLIVDMGDKKGDFFGVSSLSQKEYYSILCPDPNLVLRMSQL